MMKPEELTEEFLMQNPNYRYLMETLDGLGADSLEELARIVAASFKYFTDDEKNMSIRNNFLGSIEWQNWVATSISTNRSEMYRKIDAINKKIPGYTEQLFKDAGIKSWDESDFPRFMQGYEAGLLTQKPVKFADNPILQGIIEAGIERTNGELMNFTRTTAKVNNNLYSALDRAHFQYVTGAFSREVAVNNAIKWLASDGIKIVEYPTGHKDRMDVAARRCIVTGLSKVTMQMTDNQMKTLGCQHVEVSCHTGARNTGVGFENHEDFQGGIYLYDI